MSSANQKRPGVVARLELRYHSEDRRYFLLGHPLENGDVLECLRSDGTWMRGAFLWSAMDSSEPILVDGDPNAPESRRTSINSETLLRWPLSEKQMSRVERVSSGKGSIASSESLGAAEKVVRNSGAQSGTETPN